MKDTFHGWSQIGTYKLDTVMDFILTGRKASEAKFDFWLTAAVGGMKSHPMRVLDFGCGIGRNTFGFAKYAPAWTVVGYDNENMISRREEYYKLHYDLPMPSNAIFSSDWDEVKTQKFDIVFCCLVLQHIYEDALVQYISDFKKMTGRLFVTGRRSNDDPEKHRSTWTILQENGLTPDAFLKGLEHVPFNPEGDPEEHNTAIYEITPL